MSGGDVVLLQQEMKHLGFAIDLEDIRTGIFGETTAHAVEQFQRQHGLTPTGVVDERTAAAINASVDALDREGFVVRGDVQRDDWGQAVTIIVRAFDRDMRTEQPLGEQPLELGNRYEIRYGREQFRRAEKRSADLVVRAFSRDGTLLAESETLFNAPAVAEIDLLIHPPTESRASEYERLPVEPDPVLDDVKVAELTDADLTFLVPETGIERQRLELLRGAAQVGRDVDLPTEVFYGFARKGLRDLDRLLMLRPEVWRTSLEEAIDERIVPAALQDSLDEVVRRLEKLKEQRASAAEEPVPHEAVGRLLDRETGEPLAGFTVRAVDLNAAEPKHLGSDMTDSRGLFAVVYTTPSPASRGGNDEPVEHRLELHISDPQAQEIHQAAIRVRTDRLEVVEVQVPVPPAPEPASTRLSELSAITGLEIPPELVAALAAHGVHTLADVRKQGGISRLAGLPVTADHPAVEALEAHASLSTLSPDLAANAALIAKGYTSPLAIARAPRSEFVTVAHELAGDFKAAQMQVIAKAHATFLDGAVTEIGASIANGFTTVDQDLIEELDALVPAKCGCDDCEAAVSPLAYLADLLAYTLEHVRDDGAPVTLSFLTATFRQPFGALPASCEEMDEKVCQVRICIEVLRRYLDAKDLPQKAAKRILFDAERRYRLEAYKNLLTEIGTSYDEIRLARTAEDEERKELADRLLIGAEHVDALFLDATAQTDPIPEAALESLFGLASTTKPDPLEDIEPPALGQWRLDALRALWKSQDWPPDVPAEPAPRIDPDVIGPDDFRHPFPKASLADPDRPFDVWLFRRALIDQRLAALREEHEQGGKTLAEILTNAIGLALPELEALLSKLTASADPDAAKKAGKQVESLHLTPESFIRLMALRAKDSDGEALTGDEWDEVDSILVQAEKVAMFEGWTLEEEALGLLEDPDVFGPQGFWLSLTEPQEGAWPPELPDGVPLIDPELRKRSDVPDPTAGARALELYETRLNDLAALRDALRATHELVGFEAMLKQALGDPLPHDPDTLSENLKNGVEIEATEQAITDDLHMTVEAYTRLMALRAKDLDADPETKLTAAESSEVYTILTSAQKVRTEYPKWLDIEGDPATGVVYWSAMKAKLPQWRASTAARSDWQQALMIRSRLPLVDADLVGLADLRDPLPGNDAFDLWQARHEWIKARLAEIRDARQAAPTALGGLDSALESSLGVPAEALVALRKERDEGADITGRLDQLTLTPGAFSRLLAIRSLVEANGPVLATEWNELDSILLQVEKRRRSAQWREEEKAAGLVLSPDWFQILEPAPFEFPPDAAEELPLWRATRTDRLDWQDTLQARVDQQRAVADGLREAVSATEEAVLPMLRDALVAATDAAGGPDGKAKWVTDALLIDGKMDGCQRTTRVAQAIETLQNLLFGLRTHQLEDTYPDLSLDADDFDDEWEWIGSYATWRAAMFVFIYPENVLIPSLRRHQTPAFRAFVNELRGRRALTPQQAAEAAARYAEYFHDITHLKIEATCRASTRVRSDDPLTGAPAGYSDLVYFFARAGRTLYWSRYDPADRSGYAQSFWDVVPGMESVKHAIGAVPYRISDDERYVFLFAIARDKATLKLVFSSFDLERGTWDEEPAELELPESATAFQAVLRQRDDDGHVPHLFVRPPSGRLYSRRLNADGTDWAGDEWVPHVGRGRGAAFTALHAMVEIAPTEYYVIVSDDEEVISYRLYGANDDGRWRALAKGSFVGAFAWPGTADLYVFFSTSTGTSYHVLRRDEGGLGGFGYGGIVPLKDWLVDVAGVDLQAINVPDESPFFGGWTLFDFLLADIEDDETFKALDLLLPKALLDDVLRTYKKSMVAWLAGKIAEASDRLDEAYGDWKLAAALVSRLSVDGVSLKRALLNALRIHPVVHTENDIPKVTYEAESTYFKRRHDTGEVLEDGPFDLQLKGVVHIAPHSSDAEPSAGQLVLAYRRTKVATGIFRARFDRGGEQLSIKPPARIAPVVVGSFDLHQKLSDAQLSKRRAETMTSLFANHGGPRSNLAYVEEAGYFVPVQVALQLQARGHYTAALDWFRLVYDYSRPLAPPPSSRKIYYGLVEEEALTMVYARGGNWLLDPLSPHEIAAGRRSTYTRFTLLALVRCLLDYADAEFTRDTAESIARARTLYLTALELLRVPELKQAVGLCDQLIGSLEIELDDPKSASLALSLKKQLAQIADVHALEKTVAELQPVFANGGVDGRGFGQAKTIVAAALAALPATPSVAAVVESKQAVTASAHLALLARPSVAAAASAVASVAAEDFSQAVSLVAGVSRESLEQDGAPIPWLRQKAPAAVAIPSSTPAQHGAKPLSGDVPGFNPLSPSASSSFEKFARDDPWHAVKVVKKTPPAVLPSPSYHFCIPPNPILKALRMRAELNLFKIRTCRNIAGMERQLEPYAAATDTESGLPTIGAGGQLVLPGLLSLAPTPYRYSVLIERAKQLVGLAQQVEATMLSTIEKADAERYGMLKARQDVRLARAGVQLQNLRVKEAEGGTELAKLQQARAQLEAETYQQWLDAGVLVEEENAQTLTYAAAGSHLLAAAYAAQGIGPDAAAGALGQVAAASSAFAQVASMAASWERRKQEWEFRKALAEQDARIGAQQVKIAEDHVRVVGQERVIAELQAEQAKDVVEFLAAKFTNVELYDWMSGVLEGIYGYFLQQATATAQLAASQLGFERQEPPPPFIQADYWEAPSEQGDYGPNGKGPDRRGLTGSARLLQDIHQLDVYAFETDKRKLQLTKTISLAQLAPAELQRFRETGVITFATPMEMFDRDFPGHYLRLVRRFRTSVIALVPPTVGIRATLTSSRLSRVVIGGDFFQIVPIQRGPDQAALSSPREATGLFELDPQSDMLVPFEGIGVDAAWEFRMPKAANPSLDYNTIADVLLTIDYAALNSFDYRQQVVQTLKPTLSADRSFSLRHQFADQWYDLHNPDQTAKPMVVQFSTRRDDFPPNLNNLKIRQVLLYFARAGGQTFEVPVSQLRFTEQGGAGPVGGGSISIDGIISTRKGNAGSWMAMIGKRPFGDWELAFPATAEMKKRFQDEQIEDILLVVTYSGLTPDWPL